MCWSYTTPKTSVPVHDMYAAVQLCYLDIDWIGPYGHCFWKTCCEISSRPLATISLEMILMLVLRLDIPQSWAISIIPQSCTRKS